ncbi:DUF6516 family protein [Pseudomonas sp. NPDC007930]|uniref:toxin-antitoxin system TumE family protein n=1 Tax=Pseudomonas sp. NPDC007930 TaxID=3364417 RepID=UPI0036E68994
MKAQLLMKQRLVLSSTLFAEVVIWKVPSAVRGSLHPYKYRLALVDNGTCVVRYDNEAGKGNHKHVGDEEVPYRFRGVETLLADFSHDINTWRQP